MTYSASIFYSAKKTTYHWMGCQWPGSATVIWTKWSFPLVPKLPKHHWYQGYFYTLHVHVVLQCALHCPTTCKTWRCCWYSWAATLHIRRLPCTCHMYICLYDTDGLCPFAQFDCIATLASPMYPFVPNYAAFCSYLCHFLYMSPFVHVHHCTVIRQRRPIPWQVLQ